MFLPAAIKALACKRAIAASVVLLLATCGAGKMRASTITYDLTLTNASNALYSGNGAITLDSAPDPTGLSSYTTGEYQDLMFSIDGQTFSAPPGSVSAVEFLDGSFYDITFSEQVGTSPNRFALDTSGNYAFYYDDLTAEASGTITSSLAPAATPEPSSVLLLGTGALGVLGVLRRRPRI